MKSEANPEAPQAYVFGGEIARGGITQKGRPTEWLQKYSLSWTIIMPSYSQPKTLKSVFTQPRAGVGDSPLINTE